MAGLDTPITPLKFLERTAAVHPNKIAVVDGDRRISYSDFASIVTRLAHGFRRSGVRPETESPTWQPTQLNYSPPTTQFH